MNLKKIGNVRKENGMFEIRINKEYIPALKNLNGFSHLQIIWWGHLFDSGQYRTVLISDKAYKDGPDKMGVFATRSPLRPNPILLTIVQIHKIDYEKGIIYTPFIDAEDGSPVIDIKPYHLSERVRDCRVPEWCRHWPEWYEDAGAFNWKKELHFK